MSLKVKQFALKAAGAGADVTPDMLAKINRFALKELSAEDVFVRKFLMAHNCIDRDNECFPADMLDQFAATFPGKSMLEGHDRRSRPCGKWFDAATEEMTPEQFTALTGEKAKLPAGATTCKVLWSWGYLLKTPGNDELIQQIDGGVCSHCSIGFAAADLKAVKTDPNGPALYYEYVSPGEALEGSLVWLGAQPGATAQKHLNDTQDSPSSKGEETMKTIVALLLSLGMKSITETATEEQIAAGMKMLIDEKDAAAKALEPDAALGKAYREKTVGDYVAAKQKLGEVEDTEEAKSALKAAASRFEFSFIEGELKHLEKRVTEKFPATGQLSGTHGTDNSKTDKNPLIPE
jgi:hypothetical protein